MHGYRTNPGNPRLTMYGRSRASRLLGVLAVAFAVLAPATASHAAAPPRMTPQQAVETARVAGIVHHREQQTQGRLEGSARFDGRTRQWRVDFVYHRELVIWARVDDATGRVVSTRSGLADLAPGAFASHAPPPHAEAATFTVYVLAVLLLFWGAWGAVADCLALALVPAPYLLYPHHAAAASVFTLGLLAAIAVRYGLAFARPTVQRGAALARMPSTTQLVVLIAVAGTARYGVQLYASSAFDVGFAGVRGARMLLDAQLPYDHFGTLLHGDTYGPLNYLLYVPFVLLTGDSGSAHLGLPAAHLASFVGDLACVVLLAVGVHRRAGTRAALTCALLWLTCPATAYAVLFNTNDVFVGAFVLAAVVAVQRPWLRGALVACAAAVKLAPIVAIAALAHIGPRARRRQTVAPVGGALAVLAVAAGFVATYPDGLRHFAHATVGFQAQRVSTLTVWGMFRLQSVELVAVMVVAIALFAAFAAPRMRDERQAAAGVVAVLAATQAVLPHWMPMYGSWFAGPALMLCGWRLAGAANRRSRAAPDDVQ